MSEELNTEEIDQSREEYDKLYDEGFNDGLEPTEELEEDIDTDEEQPEEEQEEATDEADNESETEDVEEEGDLDTDSKMWKINYKGQELELSDDEMKSMAQKGFDYTSKTQSLASQRGLVEVALENELTQEDLKILADVKKGNKEAMAMLANKAGIDPYEIEDNSGEYKPEVVNRNYELEDVVENIKSDVQNSVAIDSWITNLPGNVVDNFKATPAILKGLHDDAKQGIAQKIMPGVLKHLAMNPGQDFVQVYQAVGNEVMSQPTTEETPKQSTPPSRETRKKASISKKSSSSRQLNEQKDIWEDDALYAKMQKMREQ